MSEELKPCPFCGGEAEMQEIEVCDMSEYGESPLIGYVVSCSNCCISFDGYFSSKEAAAEQWNNRSTEEFIISTNKVMPYSGED